MQLRTSRSRTSSRKAAITLSGSCAYSLRNPHVEGVLYHSLLLSLMSATEKPTNPMSGGVLKRYFGLSSELIQEPFVLVVRADPEPHHSIVSLEPNNAIVQTNPS